MSFVKSAVTSAGRYMLRNPLGVARMARHAIGMRFAIPLDALRWLVGQLPAVEPLPSEITITARPPAINIGASANVMGTDIRASASIRVDELSINPDEMRVVLQIGDIDVQAPPNSPLQQLLGSGAIDLSKPGSLLGFIPNKPPVLVDARDDMFVLDLLKVPGLSENPTFRKLLRTVTPVLTLSAIRTANDMLLFAWRPKPSGLRTMIHEIRS